MKYEIKLQSIERRLPDGYDLPTSFSSLARHRETRQRGELGWFALKYTDPRSLVGTDVREQVVPFMRLPDGGFVALWFKTKSPSVVWFGSQGGTRLVGGTWSDFLNRLVRGKTGVYDLDDRGGGMEAFAGLRLRSQRPQALAQKRTRFREWLKKVRPKPEALDPATAERVRQGLFRTLKRRLKHDHDWRDLVVTYTNRTYSVEWYSGGLKPFPNANALRPSLTLLRDALGRSLKKSELSIWGDGCVYFEKNTALGKSRKS